MRPRFKALIATAATGALLATAAVPASAAPLPDNCTKVQGEVRCFDGPGKNQGGVGTTTETQGNTSNTSPEPQDLGSTCRPPQSEGVCGG